VDGLYRWAEIEDTPAIANMTHVQLMFAGPILGMLALIAWAIPKTRPRFLSRSIGILAVSMIVPLVAAFVFHSYTLGVLAFIARPVVAAACGAVSLGYFILFRDRGFPAVTAVSPMLLIVGAAVDLYAVFELGPFIDGGA
jgi:hypothetical protein